jgi:hypothetical protein
MEMHNQLATRFYLPLTFWVSSEKLTIIGFLEINSVQKSESWGLDGELKMKCFEIENEKWKLLANNIGVQSLDLEKI